MSVFGEYTLQKIYMYWYQLNCHHVAKKPTHTGRGAGRGVSSNSLQTACLNCWRCQRWWNVILIAYLSETLFGGALKMRTDWLVKMRLMSSSVDTCKRGVTLSISYKLVDLFWPVSSFNFIAICGVLLQGKSEKAL